MWLKMKITLTFQSQEALGLQLISQDLRPHTNHSPIRPLDQGCSWMQLLHTDGKT
jgi:hypothetical protein